MDARLLRRQSPLDFPKDTVDYRFHTRFQQDFYQSKILDKAGIASEAQWVDWTHMADLGNDMMRWLGCVRIDTSRTLWGPSSMPQSILDSYCILILYAYKDFPSHLT